MSYVLMALAWAISFILLIFLVNSFRNVKKAGEIVLSIKKKAHFLVLTLLYGGLGVNFMEVFFALNNGTMTPGRLSRNVMMTIIYVFALFITTAKIHLTTEGIVYGNGTYLWKSIKKVHWSDRGFAIEYPVKGGLKRFAFPIKPEDRQAIEAVMKEYYKK